MEVICNGEKREVQPGTSVDSFIRDHGLDPKNMAVECDGVIINAEQFKDYLLQDGMVVELIRFVGGGASC